MTAGNVDVAFRPEEEIFQPDTEAGWSQYGSGTTVTELNLDNQLEEHRDPNNPIPVEQLEGNLEGAVSISTTLAGDPLPAWEDLVLDGGSLPQSGGRAPTSEVAIGLDYVGGTIERLLQGVIVTEVSLEWQQGTAWSVDLTMLYGDESTNEAFSPTDVQTVDPSKVYNHAATDVEIDAVTVKGLSSLTISLSELARFRRGTGRKPYEAVIGPISPSLDLQADFTEESPSHLELAYGDETEPVDTGAIDTAPVTIAATNRDGDELEIDVEAAKPNTYSWDELTEGDSDEQENISFSLFDDGDGAVTMAEVV